MEAGCDSGSVTEQMTHYFFVHAWIFMMSLKVRNIFPNIELDGIKLFFKIIDMMPHLSYLALDHIKMLFLFCYLLF